MSRSERILKRFETGGFADPLHQNISFQFSNKETKQQVNRILRSIEYLGNIGASREVSTFVDGDGHFGMKTKGLETDKKDIPNTEKDKIIVESISSFRIDTLLETIKIFRKERPDVDTIIHFWNTQVKMLKGIRGADKVLKALNKLVKEKYTGLRFKFD